MKPVWPVPIFGGRSKLNIAEVIMIEFVKRNVDKTFIIIQTV